jgi:hypothetical protein
MGRSDWRRHEERAGGELTAHWRIGPLVSDETEAWN